MLKLFFGVLLLGNAGLFAYQHGYLGDMFADGREPARMQNQLKADSIKLIAPDPAQQSMMATACMEIGNFDSADAARFEQRLAGIELAGKFTRSSVQEPPRHMVLIPSQGSKDAADRKTAELRRLGVSDFFIMPEGEQRWGISLGIFRTEEAARTHLATLVQKGVNTARLGRFGKIETRTAFQFRAPDAAANAGLVKLLADFPKQESRRCDAVLP
jgi:hypothetical protein